MVQKLKFAVHDVDNATKKLDDDDFLGSMESLRRLERSVLVDLANLFQYSIGLKCLVTDLTPQQYFLLLPLKGCYISRPQF